MLGAQLNLDQQDALREVINIALGRAGDSLARFLDVFVELSTPTLHFGEAGDLAQELASGVAGQQKITAIRQAFAGQLRGEAVVLFSDEGVDNLAHLLGYESSLGQPRRQEVVLDIGTIVVAACVNSIAEQLSHQTLFSAPSILAEHDTLSVFLAGTRRWKYALVMEVQLALRAQRFACKLLIFTTADSLQPLADGVDRLLGIVPE